MIMNKMQERRTNRIQRAFDTKPVKITQMVVILVAVGLIVYDIFLYVNPDENDTISEVIHVNAVKGKFFVLTWIWGIMSAHLFIARQERFIFVPERIAILLLVLISMLILLLGNYVPFDEKNQTLPFYMHIVLLLFGGVCGYFLWPQKLEKQV